MHTADRVATGTMAAHVAVTVAAVFLSFQLVGLLGYFIAGPSGSVASFVVVQSGLGALVVVFVVRWRTVSGLVKGIPALAWTGGPAAATYLLLPSAWTGAALFSWQLVGTGPLAMVLDVPVWLAAVGLGVLWGSSQQELETGPATPYG